MGTFPGIKDPPAFAEGESPTEALCLVITPIGKPQEDGALKYVPGKTGIFFGRLKNFLSNLEIQIVFAK
jgi:hypothetical protein